MTLHLNLPGASHRHSSEQQQEVREARRMLKERIRTDWEYPTLPAWRSSGRKKRDADAEDTSSVEDRIAGFRFHDPVDYGRTSNGSGEALGLDFDPVEWRERGYSSGEESGLDGEGMAKSKNGSTYKFDNPDSVGTQLSDRRIARKRKRFKALNEEMEWNDGLVHWTRRRDEWCCARTAAEVKLARPSGSTAEDEGHTESTSASAGSSPRTSTSSSAAEAPESTPGSSPSTTPEILAARSETTPTVLSPAEVLVPIAPPLLPNHPVRKRILPSMYPEIYTKIILQSRTPSVPINLQTLVNALVQGWKDDGEWPPKNAAPEKSIGRKKGSGPGGLKEGVRAVGRVLRLTGVGETSRTHDA